MRNLRYCTLTVLSAVICSAVPAAAQVQAITSTTAVQPLDVLSYEQFRPQPGRSTTIDYQAWDELLKEMVIYSGPSLRERAPRPPLMSGTSLRFGHQSPYRMEGNRILFEKLDDTFEGFVDSYTQDLIDVGNRIDITTLPRNEQLAYWLNLHNALAIQAIIDKYPTGDPSRERGPDGRKFLDSKRVTIDGTPLSLRDIREGIVYYHWRDPRVLYGFFHGDIGGPSIQRTAFTGENVWSVLKFSGDEYVNSLRGFHANGERPQYSEIYRTAAAYMFEDFEPDVRAHLASLMRPEVRQELSAAQGRMQFIDYETSTADLTRGDDDAGPSSFVIVEPLGRVSRGAVLDQAIRERKAKIKSIRKRGLMGTVTIEDVETDDSQSTVPSYESETPATEAPRE